MEQKREKNDVEKILLKLESLNASFDYLQISLASPQRIRSWAQRVLPTGEIIGEVLRPETINFRSHEPEVRGLFCEQIFGPIKNWKCKCGQYNGFLRDKICEECQVEVMDCRIRRYRMGYIELTCPVTHLWYLKGTPNYLTLLLKCYDPEIKSFEIEEIVYYKEKGEKLEGKKRSNALLRFTRAQNSESVNEFRNFFSTERTSFPSSFLTSKKKKTSRKRRGAEILKAALEALDISNEIASARSFISSFSVRKLNKKNISEDKTLIRRIRILESFLATKTDPSWMILTTLPVLPPNLRPLVELENGRLVAADVNEIYRLILTRNERLYDFLYVFMPPDLITIHGKKLLQEAVDSLIDNARLSKEKTLCLNTKPLKSLTEILEGKQGRFRQTLLGKRVDYSARSVIIVGPNLRLNQCGLPYEMAKELYQPFLINELLKIKLKTPQQTSKLAQNIIKKNKPLIWTLLGILSSKHCVLLNRAPTLHRFGIQAFDPVMVLGQAIHLHPLVCTGFNADFDGDQMAVHLPLYEASQLEARTMMRPSSNVLSPSNGEVILKPTQDMVIGNYYLTLMVTKNFFHLQKSFSNPSDALLAYYQKKLTLHTPILVRYSLNSFIIEIEHKKFKYLNSQTKIDYGKEDIYVLKMFFSPLVKEEQKVFLITNLGIFIGFLSGKNQYKITDLFLETTAGRLIFSSTFQNSLKTKV